MKADLERFIRHLERSHPNRSTKKHYVSDLNIFAQFVGGKAPREVTVKDIDAFVADQSQQQLQPATINRRLAAISSFFQFLIFEAEEDSWRNPVFWKRHSIRCGDHLPRDVKDEVAERLWAVIDDPRDQAMVALMLKAGLRVGEVVALRQATLARHHDDLVTIGRAMARAFANGATLFAFGNGGSTTDAQDIVADLFNPPFPHWQPLPAIVLTNDIAVVTAVGNDVGFDNIFTRQIIAFGKPGDIAVGCFIHPVD